MSLVSLLHAVYLVVLLSPCLSQSLRTISCVDSPAAVPGSPWKSSVPHVKTPSTRSNANRSHESWYYEGVSTTAGGEVTVSYEGESLKTLGNNGKFYLEYLNEAPRRVVLEGVSSNGEGSTNGNAGGFVLLPGDTTDKVNTGWRDGIFQISLSGNEKLKLTSILKKPQRLSIRKLVVIQSPGAVTRSTTDLLKTKSCQELAELSRLQSSVTTTTRPVTNSNTGTTPSPLQKSGGTGNTAPSCKKNKATETDDGCSVCPECKCVCNCNCNDGNRTGC